VTFPRDLTDDADVAGHVARLADEVTASVTDLERRITHVAVKVRTATFFTRSKIGKLAEPTTDPAVVVEKALDVLTRFEGGRPIRLLGVRVVLEDPPVNRS
jgi:DNA polymerase-4